MTNVTTTDISAINNSSTVTAINANTQKLRDEFEKVVYKDGREELTGNLDANSKRIINLPNAISNGEPTTLGQLNALFSSVGTGDAGLIAETAARVAGDALIRADLASETLGDTLVTTKANITTGATARTVRAKIGDDIDIKDTGAVGLNGAGDAALLTTLLTKVQPGQTIKGRRGSGAAAAFKTTNAALTLARQTDLDLEHGIDIRNDQTTGQRSNALTVGVKFTDAHKGTGTSGVDANFPDKDPNTIGEFRGGWLKGGHIFTNNLTTGLSDNLAGSYGIDVNTVDGKATIGLTIEKMRLSGGFGAVRATSSGSGREVQWLQIVRCTLGNGVTFNAEDGCIVTDCVNTGLNPGVTFNLTDGAFNCGVFRGTIANTEGAIDIQNGSCIKIQNVQMEHSNTLDSGLPSPVNPQTYGAHVIIRGTNYKAIGNEVTGANFGAGTNIANTFAIANARQTKIYSNQWNVAGPTGLGNDLLLVRDPTDANKDAYDTILGYDQVLRGVRAIQPFGVMTDTSRRMVISQTGGALRQPHRGIWFPLFSLLTAPAAGLADGSIEAMIEHSGHLAIEGSLTRATFFPDGLSIATFPTWMLPHRNKFILVHGTAGQTATAFLNVSTGVLSMNSGGLAASTTLYFGNTWHAITNPNYISGL